MKGRTGGDQRFPPEGRREVARWPRRRIGGRGRAFWAEELTQVPRLELEMVHRAGTSPAIWWEVGSRGR